MRIEFDAVYKNKTLRPLNPIPLKEGAKVSIIIMPYHVPDIELMQEGLIVFRGGGIYLYDDVKYENGILRLKDYVPNLRDGAMVKVIISKIREE